MGNSCGFYPSADFQGDVLIEWEQTAKGEWYNAFGAGMKDIFLRCTSKDGKKTVSGARFIGSQQRSLISNVGIRGFGKGYGIAVAGDTYRIEDLYLDSALNGQRTPPKGHGSRGLITWGGKVSGITAANVTVHNCETGLQIGDIRAWHWTTLEIETTRHPLAFTYNVEASQFLNCMFQHGDTIADVRKMTHPNNYDLRIQGLCHAHRQVINLPGKAEHKTARAFDVSMSLPRTKLKGRWISQPAATDQ